MASRDELYRDENFEYEEHAEGTSDYKLTADDFFDLFIVPADWTVSTIREQIQKQFNLDPDFQRRGVWNSTLKSRFIESLILGIPIPQILLSEEKGKKNAYIVLDGKQRLLTIKEFFEERFDDGRPFKLSNLENVDSLNGKSWSDISKMSDFARAIEGATIRTAILKGWRKEAVLYEIFYRLNSGSVKLSPMELRMALYRGPFLKKIIRWTEEINEVHNLLRIRNPDKRMADVEVTVRYLSFRDNSSPYRGNLKEFLDDFCKYKNDNYDESQIDLELANFTQAIASARRVFGEKALCRRWIPEEERFDTRFNRAIFDVIIGSFGFEDFRRWAIENREQTVSAFKELCEREQKFLTSIETTTKSTTATRTRFAMWYSKAQEISNIALTMPRISDETPN